jgi:type IV pilus assembly protein PilZ
MQPPSGASRERSDEAIELVVSYQRMNTFFSDYVKNISRGETFVATSEPLAIGTEFSLLLGVPDLDAPLALRARVIGITRPEQATADAPAGMGIRLSFHDAEERARTDALIERLMIEQLGHWHAERLLGRPIEDVIG